MVDRLSQGNACSKAASITGTTQYPFTQPTAREETRIGKKLGRAAARLLCLVGALVLYVFVVVAEAEFYRESEEWRMAARTTELVILMGFAVDAVVRTRKTITGAVDIALVLLCVTFIILGYSGVSEPEFLKIVLILTAFSLSRRLMELPIDPSTHPCFPSEKFSLLLSRLDVISKASPDNFPTRLLSEELQSCMCEIRLLLDLANAGSRARSYEDEQKSLTQIVPDWTQVADTRSNYLIGEVSQELSNEFADVGSFSFNIFTLRDTFTNHTLATLGHHLLLHSHLHVSARLPAQPLQCLLSSLESLYKSLPYHSATHAADVLQAMHFFVRCGRGEAGRGIEGREEAISYIAAAAHDVGHPGVSNAFLVNSRGDLAVAYNDKSVLENYHAATLFALLKKEETAIFEKYSFADYKEIRGYLVEMILSTDISSHFRLLGDVKSKLMPGEAGGEKGAYLSFLLHSADISNPTRTWKLAYAWCELIIEEYFAQGDEELRLGLPIGALNDRRTLSIPKSQIGFIDVIVQPTFLLLQEILPATFVCMENLKENREKWQDLERS